MSALLGESFRVIETVYNLIGMVAQMYTLVKTLQTICLKWMHFIVSKLYLTKLIWKVSKREENVLWSQILWIQILALLLAKVENFAQII